MTGCERLLTALNNGKPDRLPCLIDAWVEYHLKTHMHAIAAERGCRERREVSHDETSA